MLKQFDRLQPVAQLRGALKAQLLRSLLHLLPQIVHKLAALALEYQDCLHNALAVVLGIAVAQAPASAAAHVVIQAGSLLADIARKFPPAVRQ